jgi:hypothetical protein
MEPMRFHLAQVNIARMVAPLDSPTMESFVALLDEINAVADSSVGFVWRFQSAAGNATYLRPYEDDRILFNLSVWESVEALKEYTYKSAHADVLRKRKEWFSHFGQANVAMWWVPRGHIPSVPEATERLDYLQRHGPTARAFTFKQAFSPPEDEPVRASLRVRPCTAT